MIQSNLPIFIYFFVYIPTDFLLSFCIDLTIIVLVHTFFVYVFVHYFVCLCTFMFLIVNASDLVVCATVTLPCIGHMVEWYHIRFACGGPWVLIPVCPCQCVHVRIFFLA